MESKEAIENQMRVVIPYSRNKIYEIIANTIKFDDRDSKVFYILHKIFNTETFYLIKILKMPADLIEDNIKSLDRLTDSVIYSGCTEYNNVINNEIDIYADIFSELHNKIFYSSDISSSFKKSFFLKTINLFLSISKLKPQNITKLYALISHICFISSKITAAFDKYNRQIALREQDRSKWDRKLINKGLGYLDKSAAGDYITLYHLKAAVSACHCLSKSYEDTDWHKILSLYDQYLQFDNSAHVELQRAIVISKIKSPDLGLEIAEAIKYNKDLDKHPILYSTLANFHLQLHNYEQALDNYKTAYRLSEIGIEKSFYNNKIKICDKRIKMMNRYYLNKSF